MKLSTRDSDRSSAGFTLLEIMMAVGISVIVGGFAFTILSSGMSLYAKNTAVNLAHQQARSGVDEMLNNVHASVSIPALATAQTVGGVSRMVRLADASSVGPAAGIMFQRFDGGPFKIKSSVAAAADLVVVTVADSYSPRASMRFNIPSYGIESDVVATRSRKSGTQWDVTLAEAVGRDIAVSSSRPVTGFTTYRVGYLVVGGLDSSGKFLGELRYYPIIDLPTTNMNDPANYKVVARNVTSPAPFEVLLNQSGGVDNRSVAAIKLSTAEPQYSKRGYAAVNMFINSYIPFRSNLLIKQ